MNNFLFLGGDLRLIYTAAELNKRFDCFLFGNEHTEEIEKLKLTVLRDIYKFKNAVLPLPASRDDKTINAPFAKHPIPLSILPEAIERGGTVFCGKATPRLIEICRENDLKLVDYLQREELAVMNAVPTAEGTLGIMMEKRSATVYGARVLLTGHGRISKVLIKYLTVLGAKVTVAARKYSDLAWAQINGASSVHISEIDDLLQTFDVIINTVPALLFPKERLLKMKKGCLLIDLASAPCVESFEEAEKFGIDAVWALSLPGKVAPVSAGQIIADTIVNMIAESMDEKAVNTE